jgi:hypothetical protein
VNDLRMVRIPGSEYDSTQMFNPKSVEAPSVFKSVTDVLGGAVRKYVPPHLRDAFSRTPATAEGIASVIGPSADIMDMKHYGAETMNDFRAGNYLGSLANFGMTGAALGMTALPGSVGGIDRAVKKLGVDDLPLDTASRMKRADEMGHNTDAYHGTNQPDITELQPGDIGIPVGDETAANVRLNDKAAFSRGVNRYSTRGKDFGDNANILPLKVKSENPLRMDDAGEWRDPIELAKGLRTSAIGSKNPDIHKLLDDIQADADTINRSYSDLEDYLSDPEIMGMVDELREAVKGAGYDSIVYRNFTEATSQSGLDSLILLDPSQARSRFAKFDPAKKDSANLLAGVGGAGLVGVGGTRMFSDQEQ